MASYQPPAPSYAQLNFPVVVVGPQFCAQYPVDFTVVEKALHITDGNFAVTDVNGNVAFKVKGKMFSLRDRRVLLDNAGNPILSMQQKMRRQHTLKNAMLGKDMFGVTIYPNIDYAFIIALIVILDEVNDDRRD
ncbi:hypothetical protein COCNU_04G004050 [Cocos nucifera]|uniref:Protein LURP-one-related 15-like n=1 Tax=Cocos nucifera TaxID=13894 RepID=A0A8K0I5Z4_COCNU|nr:hypothetical protein COCNU_04G004050 [Cocos nucifera]